MIIKSADNKTSDIATLDALAGHPATPPATRTRIQEEIRNIRSGIKGEREAAYEIEFHYGASP